MLLMWHPLFLTIRACLGIEFSVALAHSLCVSFVFFVLGARFIHRDDLPVHVYKPQVRHLCLHEAGFTWPFCPLLPRHMPFNVVAHRLLWTCAVIHRRLLLPLDFFHPCVGCGQRPRNLLAVSTCSPDAGSCRRVNGTTSCSSSWETGTPWKIGDPFQEAALRIIVGEVARMRGDAMKILERCAAGDSPGNGFLDRAVRTAEEMVRTLKRDLETRTEIEHHRQRDSKVLRRRS